MRIPFQTLARVILALCLSFLPVTLTRSYVKGQAGDNQWLADAAMPAFQGEKAIKHLKEQGTYGSLQEAVSAIKYQANRQTVPQIAGVGAAYEFKNAAHNLLAYVTAEGIEAAGLAGGKKSWRLGLKMQEYGYGENLSAVTSGEVTAKGNRVSVKRSAIGNRQSAIEEWFINTVRGIEHGFTIDARPDHRPPACCGCGLL